MPTQASIRKGLHIEPVPAGKVLSRAKANILIAFVNAFCNGEVKQGQSTQLLIGDGKILIIVGNQGDNSGGNSSYRGEYDPTGATEFGSGSFSFGDIVRVTPGNANATTSGGTIIPGVYVCALDDPTEDDLPNHPLSPGGETEFWQWISTYPMLSSQCNSDGSTSDFASDQQEIPEG